MIFVTRLVDFIDRSCAAIHVVFRHVDLRHVVRDGGHSLIVIVDLEAADLKCIGINICLNLGSGAYDVNNVAVFPHRFSVQISRLNVDFSR